MLSYQTVNSHTLELLKKLTNEEFLSKARLVGGTALALQYGHRISIDLDFFGNIEEDNETIKEVLINIGKLSVIKESKNIKIYILDDIKIDFVNYRYNWLDPAIEENGIRLASPRDIAASFQEFISDFEITDQKEFDKFVLHFSDMPAKVKKWKNVYNSLIEETQ